MQTPYALFMTWTVYGTHLPGDASGWRHRNHGPMLPQPMLAAWHRNRLKHGVNLLDEEMRNVVNQALCDIIEFRQWVLWAVAVRSNHVHVVLSAPRYTPRLVRDQLKAKATLELRKKYVIWMERPVWTAGGDIQVLDSESDVEACARYVDVAQDRMGRKP